MRARTAKQRLLVSGLLLACVPAICSGQETALPDPLETYVLRIKPLLRNRCFSCHGALKQNAGLRLDTASLMRLGGDSGSLISRDSRSESLLLDRISSKDADFLMPPEHEGERFSEEQISWIKRWLAAGAPAPADEKPEQDPGQHWSFRSVVRPEIPQTAEFQNQHPIDALLYKQQKMQGLRPESPAPALTQVRRLYFDLIGLPPTAEQIMEFESGAQSDYRELVDKLLSDPRHGERWARHWMDVWRFSDWWGLGNQLRNSQRHMWHWRDWIVESLNEDLPYDEMIRQMLAADELYPTDQKRLRATGFLARNFFLFNRTQWMDETVEHVSKGFLGLTMNCAKCHDHKFDPIRQVDFYRMRAFFEPYHVRLDVLPGQPDVLQNGLPRAFDGQPDTPTYVFIRGDASQPDKSRPVAPGIPDAFSSRTITAVPIDLPLKAFQPERQTWVAQDIINAARKELRHTSDSLKKLQSDASVSPGDVATATAKRSSARAALDALQARSVAWQLKWGGAGEKNTRAAQIAAIAAERRAEVAFQEYKVCSAQQAVEVAQPDKRKAVRKSLDDARARLHAAIEATNTPIDESEMPAVFRGARWSATRFRNSGKDDPGIAFPTYSTGRRTALANWIADDDNPLTARVAVNHIWKWHMGQPLVSTTFDFGRNGARPVQQELLDWLAAELTEHDWSIKHIHRLIVTSKAYRMSGRNDEQFSADSENKYWTQRVPIRLESQAIRDSLLYLSGKLDETRGGPSVPANQQAGSQRRSLYFFHSNNQRNLFLSTFDEANVTDCYLRDQSVVPQQALAMINSRLAIQSAAAIRNRISSDGLAGEDFIRQAFRRLAGFSPDEREVKMSLNAISRWSELPDTDRSLAETNFVWSLINHTDFVTLR